MALAGFLDPLALGFLLATALPSDSFACFLELATSKSLSPSEGSAGTILDKSESSPKFLTELSWFRVREQFLLDLVRTLSPKFDRTFDRDISKLAVK